MTGAVTVNAGANIAPGNGGNNTAILTTGPLTLASTSNFRVDINGTTAGTGYDRLSVATGGVTTTSQSGQHCRPGRHFSFWTKSPGAALPATLRGSHKGVPWWAATVPFSRSLTTQAMATTSCSRWSRCRSPNRAHRSAVCLRPLGSFSLSVADCGRRQFSDICPDGRFQKAIVAFNHWDSAGTGNHDGSGPKESLS